MTGTSSTAKAKATAKSGGAADKRLGGSALLSGGKVRPGKGKGKGKAGSGPRAGIRPAPGAPAAVVVAPRAVRRRWSIVEHILCGVVGFLWISMIGLQAAAMSTGSLFGRSLVVCAGLCLTAWTWAYIFPPGWPRWRSLFAVAFLSTAAGAAGVRIAPSSGSGPIAGLVVGLLTIAWCHPGVRARVSARIPLRRTGAGPVWRRPRR